MNQDVFEKYSVPKAVLTLALPTVLSMLVTVLYNMADTYFVGQTHDSNQVAAVSLATPVFLLFMACGILFGSGGSSYISRSLGSGHKDRVKKISSFCFYAGIFAGIILMIFFFVGMPWILKIIGADTDTEGYARDYLTYIAIGGAFIVISNSFGNIVRGEGAAKVAMFGMMLGTIVNVVLDPIMILALDMGVAGAAIATVIGNLSSVIFYIVYLNGKNTMLSIRLKDFSIRDGIIPNVVGVGLPASLNNLLMSVANIILNKYLVSYGNVPVAAMGVASKANMLAVFLQLGIGMGIQPLVGYSFGAKNYERMKKIMHFAMICTTVIGVTVTTIYFFNTQSIVRIFIDDPEVIDYGITMLRALMVSSPFLGLLFCFNFTFQAMGEAIQSLILSISRQGLVFLPVVVIANALVGLDGIIFAQPIADLASLLMAAIMFKVIIGKIQKA